MIIFYIRRLIIIIEPKKYIKNEIVNILKLTLAGHAEKNFIFAQTISPF
jgi:hypothetical protein